MPLHDTIAKVTDRIVSRSTEARERYVSRMEAAAAEGPRRAHLTCGNQAHAYAAMGEAQHDLANGRAPNLGIITAYNDMLSAHQPFERFPELIRQTTREKGATAQVAGGVPAMC
ncbi:MAG: phosphogluconate dehydratase, partial [Pseudomonadota bacterium]